MSRPGWLILAFAAALGAAINAAIYADILLNWFRAVNVVSLREWLSGLSGVFSAVLAIVAIYVSRRLHREVLFKEYSELVDVFRTAHHEYDAIKIILTKARELCDALKSGSVPPRAGKRLLDQYMKRLDASLGSEAVMQANLWGGNLIQPANLAIVRTELFFAEARWSLVFTGESGESETSVPSYVADSIESSLKAIDQVSEYVAIMQFNTEAWALEWQDITNRKFKNMLRSARGFEERTRKRMGEYPRIGT